MGNVTYCVRPAESGVVEGAVCTTAKIQVEVYTSAAEFCW